MNVVEPNKNQRRLVIITGDKGGVGKSTFARGLIETYLGCKKDFLIFDADKSNPQIKRFYSQSCQVEDLDIFKVGKADLFLDNLKTLVEGNSTDITEAQPGKSLFVLELPPQSQNLLQKFVEEMDFLLTLKDFYNIRVTMVVVISRVVDSVYGLIKLHDYCGSDVDYVVVKNLFFGEEDTFGRYAQSNEISKIKYALKQSNLAHFFETTMPDLIYVSYDFIDQHNLTFKQAMEQTEKPSVKGRVTAWMRTFKNSIDECKDVLGLQGLDLKNGL
jgi:hypothetical protein